MEKIKEPFNRWPRSVKTMFVIKLIVFVIAASIGGFSFGSLFNFIVACITAYLCARATEPSWGRVVALSGPFAAYWALSTFILPDLFPAKVSALQLAGVIFVFGVPLDAFQWNLPRLPKRERYDVAKRTDDIIDADIVDAEIVEENDSEKKKY